MKGQIEQYKWKAFGTFNNERTYWANQIKGLMDRLILEKDTVSNTNERCNEL